MAFILTFSEGWDLDALDYVGMVVWVFGFVFETISDMQMNNFKKNPANKGKLINEGLWRYSRHPNYFGEFCVWWGYYLICCSLPYGWACLPAPLLSSFFLNTVFICKGIPGYP